MLARTKGEARRIAEERGCEDIIKVRRIGWPVTSLVVVTLIVVGLLFLL